MKAEDIKQSNLLKDQYEVWSVLDKDMNEVELQLCNGWGNEPPEEVVNAVHALRPPLEHLGHLECIHQEHNAMVGSDVGMNAIYYVMFVPIFGDAYRVGTIQYTMKSEYNEES